MLSNILFQNIIHFIHGKGFLLLSPIFYLLRTNKTNIDKNFCAKFKYHSFPLFGHWWFMKSWAIKFGKDETIDFLNQDRQSYGYRFSDN